MESFDKRLKEVNSLICGLLDEIDEIQATTEAEIKILAVTEEKLENISSTLRNMSFNMYYLEKMKSNKCGKGVFIDEVV